MSGVLYLPVTNLVQTIQLKKLPDSNFNDTDGKIMRTGLSGLWWLMTGKGTGLRYFVMKKGLTVKLPVTFHWSGEPDRTTPRPIS